MTPADPLAAVSPADVQRAIGRALLRGGFPPGELIPAGDVPSLLAGLLGAVLEAKDAEITRLRGQH